MSTFGGIITDQERRLPSHILPFVFTGFGAALYDSAMLLKTWVPRRGCEQGGAYKMYYSVTAALLTDALRTTSNLYVSKRGMLSRLCWSPPTRGSVSS